MIKRYEHGMGRLIERDDGSLMLYSAHEREVRELVGDCNEMANIVSALRVALADMTRQRDEARGEVGYLEAKAEDYGSQLTAAEEVLRDIAAISDEALQADPADVASVAKWMRGKARFAIDQASEVKPCK